jgi:fucose permease
MPVLIDNFQLNLTLAAFLPFSFFLAYGIMSIPAGMMIELFGKKLPCFLPLDLRWLDLFFFITLGYILSVSFWANPLVNNKTVKIGELLKKT